MGHSRLLVPLALAVSLSASAQDAGTGTSKAPKPAAAKQERPKPNPALTEAFQSMTGTWACTGTMESPTSPGTQVASRGEMRITPQVDGFAYAGIYKMEKNAAMPSGSKAELHWGYDEAKKSLVEIGFDNYGNSWQGTSDGNKADVQVWNEEGSMMGQAAKSRTTVTRKSPKEILILSEMEDRGAWRKMGEDRCRKK
jgi:hypothetical protein